MASHYIEDIELLRRKSGISYQEAIDLLDAHNGDVARALAELERNGRLKPETGTASRSSDRKSGSAAACASWWFTILYRARIKVRKDDTPVLNVSVLVVILALVLSPRLTIGSAILCLLLGYKFGFTKNDPDFSGEKLERLLRTAAEKIKAFGRFIASKFQDGTEN